VLDLTRNWCISAWKEGSRKNMEKYRQKFTWCKILKSIGREDETKPLKTKNQTTGTDNQAPVIQDKPKGDLAWFWFASGLIGLMLFGLMALIRSNYLGVLQSPKMPFLSNEDSWVGAPLEILMYRYGTDKSKDDHKYSDLYSMLFDPFRFTFKNITEVGIATGQSLKVWHDYFPKASIHGLDIRVYKNVKHDLQSSKRIHLHEADSTDRNAVAQSGLAPGTMDVVIDDGSHNATDQEQTLQTLWPLVRPGGYYTIEDVEWDRHGDSKQYPFLHNPEKLQPPTLKILQENDAFFADTTLGHRAWEQWQKASTTEWAKDRFSHNSHVVVIRKRIDPLMPVQVNFGSAFMNTGGPKVSDK